MWYETVLFGQSLLCFFDTKFVENNNYLVYNGKEVIIAERKQRQND